MKMYIIDLNKKEIEIHKVFKVEYKDDKDVFHIVDGYGNKSGMITTTIIKEQEKVGIYYIADSAAYNRLKETIKMVTDWSKKKIDETH